MEGESSQHNLHQSHGRKRPHNLISTDSTRASSQPPWISTFTEQLPSAAYSHSFDSSLTLPPIRFAGDGLDCRRPVMSAESPPDVIDLTAEPDSPQRPHPPHPIPRNTSHSSRRPASTVHEIIDLEDEDGGDGGDLDSLFFDMNPSPPVEDSPDVEILYSAPRVTPPSPRPQRMRMPQGPGMWHASLRRHRMPPLGPAGDSLPPTRHRWNLPSINSSFPNLLGLLQQRMPGGMNTEQSTVLNAEMTRRGGINERTPRSTYPPYPRMHAHRQRPRADEVVVEAIDLNDDFQLPFDLDFQTQAFQLGVEEVVPNRTYTTPPSPRAGFTRSPQEDDIVVCPNCDDELGAGENDLKRQVWFIKKCGHVYCGECTKHRTAKKGKEPRPIRSRPFPRCVVEGCVNKSPIGPGKSMIQVYI